jgi:ribonucleoside-diphosphate reductase alpha subunit
LVNGLPSASVEIKKDITIVDIEYTGRQSPTYCFTEPKMHKGVFNGILTGNCTEIFEVTDNQSVSVCNLASISLPAFVDTVNNKFNYGKLGEVVEIITENLNKVIDINFYPINEAKTNNLNYRPIGIGIQGLADVFALLDFCWGDEGSKKTNKLIAETIYYYALKKSCELSKLYGSYNGFQGSPASEGILQYHMWEVTPLTSDPDCEIHLDWETLIKDIKEYGLRNSLLVAPMPTASTSQILGNNESFEMFTSNIFSRSTLAGDFTIVNKHLYRDLNSQNLWSPELVNKILENDGSIQTIAEISQHIKNKYKTVWELSQRLAIDYAADRGPFIDQSQSLNLYLDYPTHSKLTSMHFYGWKKGLKTNNYYIHSKPSRGAVKFTVSATNTQQISTTESQPQKFKCVGEDGICMSCSS